MKTNELRLNNYVLETEQVVLLSTNYDLFKCLVNVDREIGYKPIPLTEEWLLKFGFKKVGINFELNSIVIWYSSYEKCFVWRFMNVGEDADRKVRLDYLHQLQNLYFALTGEELTIKSE